MPSRNSRNVKLVLFLRNFHLRFMPNKTKSKLILINNNTTSKEPNSYPSGILTLVIESDSLKLLRNENSGLGRYLLENVQMDLLRRWVGELTAETIMWPCAWTEVELLFFCDNSSKLGRISCSPSFRIFWGLFTSWGPLTCRYYFEVWFCVPVVLPVGSTACLSRSCGHRICLSAKTIRVRSVWWFFERNFRNAYGFLFLSSVLRW